MVRQGYEQHRNFSGGADAKAGYVTAPNPRSMALNASWNLGTRAVPRGLRPWYTELRLRVVQGLIIIVVLLGF